jgi:hypothetical protein
MSDAIAAEELTATTTLQGKIPAVGERAQGKYCRTCGRWMWVADVEGVGPLWHCANCHYSLRPDGEKVLWSLPRRDQLKRPTKERKYRGQDPCPRCSRSMWVLEIPEYGSRKQCEDCRISVIPGGAVLEWRARQPEPSD